MTSLCTDLRIRRLMIDPYSVPTDVCLQTDMKALLNLIKIVIEELKPSDKASNLQIACYQYEDQLRFDFVQSRQTFNNS